jgi:hypothetical protein
MMGGKKISLACYLTSLLRFGNFWKPISNWYNSIVFWKQNPVLYSFDRLNKRYIYSLIHIGTIERLLNLLSLKPRVLHSFQNSKIPLMSQGYHYFKHLYFLLEGVLESDRGVYYSVWSYSPLCHLSCFPPFLCYHNG